MWYRYSMVKRVSLVVVFDGEKVLLGKKPSGFWLPGGHANENESSLDAAIRELKEETGLKASSWILLQEIHTSNSVTDEKGYIFLAEDLDMGEPEFEDTEDISILKIPFTEALEWVISGKITDSLSVIGILLVARKLGL